MRSAGILMHITSLPSRGGIGDLGPEAYRFADFLCAAGMKVWQVLPIGPTGYGESPYQSSSAYAGNPLLISPEFLRRESLLDFDDQELYAPGQEDRVDFDAVRENRMMLLRRAWRQSGAKMAGKIEQFRREQPWAEDYALFAALKNRYGDPIWREWPEGLGRRRKKEMDQARQELKDEIDFHLFCQYLFRSQWFQLKKYCADRGISLFGDMPIYVAEDSADTWAHPEVFQLDRNLVPVRVAGVPPDYFSEDGQLWGNPLYRWHRMRWNGYAWWADRMKGMASLYDIVRIDHFIGFANYYSIPYGAPNARNGKWVIGPGKKLFKKLKKAVPDLRIIAEDLGEVNDRVRALVNWCGYAGMKVLTFGFDGDPASNPHDLDHYHSNCVAYTGTHDNDTVLGWAEKANSQSLAAAKKKLGFRELREAPQAFIRAVLASPCELAVIPMQDILGLGGEARMNLPGTIGNNNWRWRMRPGQLTEELAHALKAQNVQTHRAEG